jgi:23S rRNA (uracil1939-C5)-methyltransferase
LELTVEKLVYGGDGLAHLPADERGPGKTAFVPFVLESERIEAAIEQQKPGFARARAERILTPSPQRITPLCPYFQSCGGCHYQHSSYEHQLEIKAAILKETLRRIAKIDLPKELAIHASPPWKYRNRTRLRVQTGPDFAIGYYKFNSHELLKVEECPISSPLINRALAAFWQLGREGRFPADVQEIECFSKADDSEILVGCYCVRGMPKQIAEGFGESLTNTLPEMIGMVFFPAHDKDSSTARVEPIHVIGKSSLIYKARISSYRVSAGSFFQVNRFLTDELVGIVTDSTKGRTVVDLYAGVGLFSSILNRRFERVIAIESSAISHSDLVYNSPSNVKAVRSTVERYLHNISGKLKPDLVIVDPPRSGLGEKVVSASISLQSPQITYVSCNPATLARDMRALTNSGYKIENAHLIDLFPQTYHLESVFHLVRQ